MNSPRSQHGFNGTLPGTVAGTRPVPLSGFLLATYVTATTFHRPQPRKAAGPERPASAAGIGPFRLRSRSRALRSSSRIQSKEN